MTDEMPDWFKELLRGVYEKNKKQNPENKIISDYLREKIRELEG